MDPGSQRLPNNHSLVWLTSVLSMSEPSGLMKHGEVATSVQFLPKTLTRLASSHITLQSLSTCMCCVCSSDVAILCLTVCSWVVYVRMKVRHCGQLEEAHDQYGCTVSKSALFFRHITRSKILGNCWSSRFVNAFSLMLAWIWAFWYLTFGNLKKKGIKVLFLIYFDWHTSWTAFPITNGRKSYGYAAHSQFHLDGIRFQIVPLWYK